MKLAAIGCVPVGPRILCSSLLVEHLMLRHSLDLGACATAFPVYSSEKQCLRWIALLSIRVSRRAGTKQWHIYSVRASQI